MVNDLMAVNGFNLNDLAKTKENDDVQPVSDPNIFSESQRYAQFQAVMQMAQDQRVQYNVTELHRWGLQLLRVDNADDILPKPLPYKNCSARPGVCLRE